METSITSSNLNEPVGELKKEEGKSIATLPKVKQMCKVEKSRGKDDKNVEQLLKKLSGFQTIEEKVSAMCKKYMEAIDENRKLQMTVKQTEKRALIVQREKEQVESEKSKAVLTRSRVESLCRELQKQNKILKEESVIKVREQEEKLKDLSAKFQISLAEIKVLVAENNDKNSKLQEQNVEIHNKLISMLGEVKIRELNHQKVYQVMSQQLFQAEQKRGQTTLELTREKETLLKEKSELLLKLTQYQTKINNLETIEVNLRGQVDVYSEKYNEFQTAVTKSNKIFSGFNTEMEKMSKKILKLEKETALWKSRWEKSRATLLEMAADKEARDGEMVTLNIKYLTFQTLSKTLQKERATLLAELKAAPNKLNVYNNQQNLFIESQNLAENTDVVDNLITKKLVALNNTNAIQNENETKELKTEDACSQDENTEANSNVSNVNVKDITTGLQLNEDTSKAVVNNINSETVNIEDKERLENTLSVTLEETKSTINNNIVTADNSLEYKSDKLLNSTLFEPVTPESKNIDEMKNEETTTVHSNSTNVIQSIKDLHISHEFESHLKEPEPLVSVVSESEVSKSTNTDQVSNHKRDLNELESNIKSNSHLKSKIKHKVEKNKKT